MAPALLTYTLPTLQLVCHLVTTGNTNISGTTPGIIDAPSPTPSAPPLPLGYVAYPEFGVAYKVSNETVSWDVAKNRCAYEGAYLATIDTFAKIKLLRSQQQTTSAIHVGFYLEDGNDNTWYSVYTGLPAASVPWKPGEPSGNGRCVQLWDGERGLDKIPCSHSGAYACQIQYP